MTTVTTKPTTGNPTDAIARHQFVSNAISTATWHLHNGRTEQALGRILSAARHLKQACTELTTSGRA
jgi:hypothetical protein